MSNEKYNGEPLVARKRRRCEGVSITNKLGTLPAITFIEEDIVEVEGLETLHNQAGSVGEQLTPDNVSTSFPIVDPDTRLPTGATMTFMDFAVATQSLYAFLADRRDAQQAGGQP